MDNLEYLDEDLFTMSNLSPRRTGLPFVVWISPRGNAQYDVRIRVSRSLKATPGEFITVAVHPVAVVSGVLPNRDFATAPQVDRVEPRCPRPVLERRHRIYRRRTGAAAANRMYLSTQGG